MSETPTWMERGACRGTSLVFVDDADPPEIVAAAKRVCASCPVTAACLEHALTVHERFGMWGGMTTNERRAQARARTVRARDCAECGQRFKPPLQPGTPVICCSVACAQQRRRRQLHESRLRNRRAS